MSMDLNAEVRNRVDMHLEAVEQVLVAAGHTREARRAVVDDLEAQILEMLSQGGVAPTVADVEAVLGRLDAPAAYGEGGSQLRIENYELRIGGQGDGVKSRYSRTAIWGLVCVLVSWVPMGVLGVVVMWMAISWAPRPMERRIHAVEARQAAASGTKLGVDVTVSATQAEDPFAGGEALPGVTLPALPQLVTPVPEPQTSIHAAGSLVLVLVVGLPGALLGLLGTILGWVAYGQIKAAQGMLLGRGMALFDGLFYPVLTVVVVVGGGLLVMA